MRVGGITSTGGNVALTVPYNDPSGDDFIMASGSSITATQGSMTIDVADNVTIPAGTTSPRADCAYPGRFRQDRGCGRQHHRHQLVRSLHPIAKINGGPDDDIISLTNVPTGTVMTITTGGGVNTVNIGSIPPPEPNKGILKHPGTVDRSRAMAPTR